MIQPELNLEDIDTYNAYGLKVLTLYTAAKVHIKFHTIQITSILSLKIPCIARVEGLSLSSQDLQVGIVYIRIKEVTRKPNQKQHHYYDLK